MLLYQVVTFSDENRDISVTIKYIKNIETSGVEIPEVFDFLEEAEKSLSCHSLADKCISVFKLMAFHDQKPQRSSSPRMDFFSSGGREAEELSFFEVLEIGLT